MFISAIHAAAPHTAAMTMGYLWEGRPLPGPPPLGEGTGLLPAGRGGWGNPVSPFPDRWWERLAPRQGGVRFDRLTAGGETRFPRMFTSGGSHVLQSW